MYVSRNDIEKDFEDKIVEEIFDKKDRIAIVGLPGIGKSTLARIIVAKYNKKVRANQNNVKDKAAILLSLGQSIDKVQKKPEWVQIDNKGEFVPIVSVPSNLTKSEDILKIIPSLKSQSENLKLHDKNVKALKESTEKAKQLIENGKDIGKAIFQVKDKLLVIVEKTQLIPKDYGEILKFADNVCEGASFIGVALNIIEIILKYKTKKELKNLDLLVILDDLGDLGTNWEVLSGLWEYNFKYIFTMRVTESSDHMYLFLDNKNPSYANNYLRNIGITNVDITRKIVLYPPQRKVFNDILKAHNIIEDKILKDLWQYSGGIPGNALHLYDENKKTNHSLDNIFEDANKLKSKAGDEFYWEKAKKGIRKNIAYFLNVADDLEDDIKHKYRITKPIKSHDYFAKRLRGDIDSLRTKLIKEIKRTYCSVSNKRQEDIQILSILEERLTDEEFEKLYDLAILQLQSSHRKGSLNLQIFKSDIVNKFFKTSSQWEREEMIKNFSRYDLLSKYKDDPQGFKRSDPLYEYTSIFKRLSEIIMKLEFGDKKPEILKIKKEIEESQKKESEQTQHIREELKKEPKIKEEHIIQSLNESIPEESNIGKLEDLSISIDQIILRLLRENKHKELQYILNKIKNKSILLDYSNTDLSNIHIDHIKLKSLNYNIRINFSCASLRSTILSNLDFEGNNLSNADLSNATLDDVDLSNANLTATNLQNATLKNCRSINRDTYSLKLSKSYLFGAKILFCNISKADMTEADLTGVLIEDGSLTDCNLSNSKLCGARLLGTRFVNGNLSNADFRSCLLIGCKPAKLPLGRMFGDYEYYKDLYTFKCKNSNFYNSIIDNQELVEYLRNKGALNVPDAVRNIQQLKDELKKRRISDEEIQHILRYTDLVPWTSKISNEKF